MAKEIERKFLVTGNFHDCVDEKVYISQGYFPTDESLAFRVRITNKKAWLTLKGKTEGFTRLEYEYEIPLPDAREMMENLVNKPVIEKYRYIVYVDGMKWEVDKFLGENEGLILAEVELEHASQKINLPGWLGQEVSEDYHYYNVYLSKHPYKTWRNH